MHCWLTKLIVRLNLKNGYCRNHQRHTGAGEGECEVTYTIV